MERIAMKQILIDVHLDENALRVLRALPGVGVQVVPLHRSRDAWPPDLIHGCHFLLCKFPPTNFDDLKALEFMQLSTVGYEHLRDLGLGDRTVRVCNARGLFDTAIGEWNLAMMVNLTRDLRGMIRRQEYGAWDRATRFHQEVRGRTVGLWGYGGIGRETARLAKAFGLTVHVLTREPVGPRPNAFTIPGTGDTDGVLPDRVFAPEQRKAFLSGLDFLILALPHTRQSNGMVGIEVLRALPRTAFVLNPARGPIIQEQALLAALREGWIAGAALDTHFAYPLPPDHPLWQFPNVILTPHISGSDRTPQFPERMGDLFVKNVERFLTGQPLLNLVSAAEWREA
jgi:phosphoglycerate dehydrogenase-like enzyme